MCSDVVIPTGILSPFLKTERVSARKVCHRRFNLLRFLDRWNMVGLIMLKKQYGISEFYILIPLRRKYLVRL
jgi:hypothetical protein